MENIGRLVRNARVTSGLDQAELARRAATTQTYVSRVERGATMPSLPTLERLLHAMGLRLQLSIGAVPTGNSDPADLRREFLSSTPEQRLDEAMELSAFVTELALPTLQSGQPSAEP